MFPKQIGETATVAVTSGMNALFVNFVFGFEGCEYGVEEPEVPVLLIAGGFLPAGAFAFGIGELAGSI